MGGQPPEDLLAKLSTLQNQIASIKSRNEALRAQLKDVAGALYRPPGACRVHPFAQW